MDLPLIVARFVHFAATKTLFGAAFFTAVLAPASLVGDVGPLMRRIAVPLALVALASAVAWLVCVARDMTGGDLDPAALGAVLNDTAFGEVWRGRLALLALLVGATLRPDRRWRLTAAAAGLAVASLGLVGHAAMQTGALGLAHRLNHALHLLATSAWFGGLPPFLVCLWVFRAAPERRDSVAAMRRYSGVGHFAVAAVFVTGALNIAMTSRASPWPPTTPYRIGLDVKLLAFAAMTAIALCNRYLFAPRVGQSAGYVRALTLGALAELTLAGAALASASALATFDPFAA